MCIGSSCENECSNFFKALRNINSEEEKVDFMMSNPYEAISCLIQDIDKNEKGVIGYHNPYSSTFFPYFSSSYLGIDNAYYVELILSLDTTENQMLSSRYDSRMGVIVPIEDKKPVFRALNYEELIDVKKLYQEWWSKSRNKSLQTLRLDWSKGNSILDSSRFVWR